MLRSGYDAHSQRQILSSYLLYLLPVLTRKTPRERKTVIRCTEFTSEGATLRGRLYLPDGHGVHLPVVIMAQGTSATIPMIMDRYAEVFSEAGFAALAYDHRNFGISDGQPRQEINPWVQARGYRDAISYVESLPEIDPSRIAISGDSFSAGEAIVVAAMDEHVRAVVAQCPVCGSKAPQAKPDEARYRMIREVFLRGEVSGTPETTAGPMPVVSFDQIRHPSLLKPVSAFRWFMEHGERHGSGWANDVTRVIPPTPAPFSPMLCAPYVKAATLMMVAPEDEMVQCNPQVSRRVYDLLGGPKQWYEIAGGHFGLLWHPSELFDEATRVQREFLRSHFL
jgi:poly(3-hydroxybutyrate) depolymerase